MNSRQAFVWPPLIPRTIEVEKPVTEYIRDWAEYRPDGIAIRFYGTDINYQELNEAIDRFANGLLNLGLQKGDRVAIFMQNCPQFVIGYFGVLRAGGIVVSLNPMFKKAELAYELNDAGAEYLLALDYLYPEVEKIRSETSLKHVIIGSLTDYLPAEPSLPLPPEASHPKVSHPDAMDFMETLSAAPASPVCHVEDVNEDLALLQYTGGTTGLPKGAMITHANLACASIGTVHWFRHRYDDVHLGVTPFFHIMGMQQLMCTPLVSGGQVVILTRFETEVVARAIERYRCTYWVTATTSLIALLELPGIEKISFASLRCLWSGGTPISVEIQKKIAKLAPQAVIGEGYGMTENTAQGGVCTPLLRYKPGFVGTAQLNRLKIVDLETGTDEVPFGDEGEIVIKGPTIMKGYWNRPEETAATMQGGWLYTGDIGVMDEEGYVKVVGRKKELIKCSGFSVFPVEVENLLFRHPAVSDVAIIGVPDPYRGESPKAFIILKTEFRGKVSEQDIIDWCKDNMSTYKRPRDVEFRDDLPKSAAGKILRRVLVEDQGRPREGR